MPCIMFHCFVNTSIPTKYLSQRMYCGLVVGTYLECGHNGSSKYPRVQIPVSILLGNSNVFSGQKRCIIAPGYFESDLWSSSNWTYPDPPESWWHPCWMPKPLQLVPFNMKDQWFYSLIKPPSLTLI